MVRKSLNAAVVSAALLAGALGAPGSADEAARRAGCADIVDVKGDGTASVAGVPLPNDDDLDIVSVAFRTTASSIEAHITVAKYSASGPQLGTGHRFDFAFTAAGHAFVFASDKTATVDGKANASIKVASSVDAKNNTIVVAVDRPSLDAAAGVRVGEGTVVTGTAAHSHLVEPGGISFAADTAQEKDAAKQTYTVGASVCFAQGPSPLRYVGALAGQYSDKVRLAATLKVDDKEEASGKRITFQLGSTSASAVTNGEGRAEAQVTLSLAAGTYSVTASFAGDQSVGAASASASFTVRVEATRLTLSGDASVGFTATLAEDDGRPVAGEEVEWEVDGKVVAESKTDKNGRARWKGAKKGAKVKAKFRGKSRKYGGSEGERRG